MKDEPIVSDLTYDYDKKEFKRTFWVPVGNGMSRKEAEKQMNFLCL